MAVYKEEGKRMKTKKIGFIAGILVALIIHFLPLQGIEPAGQTCLALTLMTVVWWATQVAQSGYVGRHLSDTFDRTRRGRAGACF